MGIGQGSDGVFLGFFESGTQQLLPVETCFLVDEDFRMVIDGVRSGLRSLVIEGMNLESVEIRSSQLEKEYLLVFRGQAMAKDRIERLMNACSEISNIKGWIYEPVDASERDSRRRMRQEPIVRGSDHLWEGYGGLRLKVGFRSFMQANWDVFQLLGQDGSRMAGRIVKGRTNFGVICRNRPVRSQLREARCASDLCGRQSVCHL